VVDRAMTLPSARRQLFAVASAYSLATAPFNVSPLLVSAVITVLGANEQQAGQLMTLELLSMSVAAMVLAPFGQIARRTPVVLAAVLLLIAVHGVSALVNSYALLLGLRLLAGIGAGALLLAVNTTIAASDDPVRLYGLSAMAATTVSVLLLFVMPALIAAKGMVGAYGPLLVLAVLLLGVFSIARMNGHPGPVATAADAPGSSRVSLASTIVLLFALFIIQFTQAALYAFSERIGVERAGLNTESMGLLLAVAYMVAVPASALASWLSYRLGRYIPLLIGFGVYILAALIVGTTQDSTWFIVSFLLLSFSYFFVLPYQLGIPADLDHSGRLSGIGVGTLFIGLSCGAFLGGFLVTHYSYRSLGIVAAVAASLGLVLLIQVIRSNRAVAQAVS